MGVAFRAKPAVAAAARLRIDHGDLTALLYLQGYRRDEFARRLARGRSSLMRQQAGRWGTPASASTIASATILWAVELQCVSFGM